MTSPPAYSAVPLKYLCSANATTLPETTDPDYEFDYIDIGSVDRHVGVVRTERLRFGDAPSRARRLVRADDVIVSTVRTYLRAVARIDPRHDGAIASTGFVALTATPEVLDARFLGYCVTTPEFVESVVTRSVGVSYPGINTSDLVRIWIPRPPLALQAAIADFLDRECDRIEAIVTGIVQLVALVTDSHWENAAREMLLEPGQRKGVPLKRLVERPVGGSWGSEPGEGEVDVVVARVADFDRPSLALRRCETIRSVSQAAASRLALADGDLLIEKSGGGEKSPVGFVVGYSGSGISISSNFLARLRPTVNVDPTYLAHLFGALYAAGRNVPYVRQVTGIQNLDLSGYLTEHVPVREIAEQRDLGQRLRRRLEQVNALRARCTIAGSRLSEYRDALITEAVTGQLDVARLSDAQLDESAHAALEGETPEVLAR